MKKPWFLEESAYVVDGAMPQLPRIRFPLRARRLLITLLEPLPRLVSLGRFWPRRVSIRQPRGPRRGAPR